MSKTPYIREWLPAYQRSWFSTDVFAGISVWAVLAPTAMAYTSLVGVEPIVGLYCIPLGLLAYALFGSSRLMVVGPDATVAVLSGAVIVSFAASGVTSLGLAISLALVVGLLFFLCSLLRLGWISDLIPRPVLKGVVEGIVWMTILKELSHLFGIHMSGANTRFFPRLLELINSLGQIHYMTLIVGAGCLAALFLMARFLHKLPGAFIVLLAALGASTYFGLADKGVETIGKIEEGGISMDLFREIDPLILFDMVPGGMAIVIVGFALTIAAAKGAAEKTGEAIDANKELLALGASNIGVGISGGFPIIGSLSKTGVAIEAGGKSQVGNLVAAALTIFTILFLAPYLGPLPNAALAAVVIMVMFEVSDIPFFLRIKRVNRRELIIGLMAIAGVFAYGALMGVMIGTALGLALLAEHISRPPTAVLGRSGSGEFLPKGGPEPVDEILGLMIWRQYAPLVFLNARRLASSIQAQLESRQDITVVLIDALATSGIDSTGLDEFVKLRARLTEQGIDLWVANVREPVWRRIATDAETMGRSAVPKFATLGEAISAFENIDQ